MKLTWKSLKRWQKGAVIGVVLYLSIFLVLLVGYLFQIPALTHPEVHLFVFVPFYLGSPMTYLPLFLNEEFYESLPFLVGMMCMLLLGSFQWFLWGIVWSTVRTFNPYRIYRTGSGK